MTNNNDIEAVLFDFDGVVMDTESQYSIIWGNIGKKYHPEIPNFDMVIKGQTLTQIFDTYFNNNAQLQDAVTKELNEYESCMEYRYVEGAKEFIESLRVQGIATALVTSSNNIKMANVYRAHHDFKQLWDAIVTADLFTHSKPDPECFLMGAKLLNKAPQNCVVIEDSLHGMKAGRAAGMRVIGVATTYSRDAIGANADVIIDNFIGQDINNLFN